jgi:hypothetical protein
MLFAYFSFALPFLDYPLTDNLTTWALERREERMGGTEAFWSRKYLRLYRRCQFR